jgi:hypothetical protein
MDALVVRLRSDLAECMTRRRSGGVNSSSTKPVPVTSCRSWPTRYRLAHTQLNGPLASITAAVEQPVIADTGDITEEMR